MPTQLPQPAQPARRRRQAGPGGSRRDRVLQSLARRAVVAMSAALGVSSTRRAFILAAVVCALALSVAVPLRNYVGQRQELAGVLAERDRLTAEVSELVGRRAQLASPAEVSAQARSRLGYVLPGETPYLVQLPGDDPGPTRAPGVEVVGPWYARLWSDVQGSPR